MRFKGTLVLLLVSVGLGAFLYFYEIRGKEGRDRAERESKQLWTIDSDDIQEMELAVGDGKIRVVRSGEGWQIREPRSVAADSEELDRIASSAADLSWESVIEAAEELSRFGLDPPRHTLKVRTSAGEEFQVGFGSQNPTGTSTYAAQAEDRVFLLPSHTASTFRREFDDLREKSILKFDQYETRRLELRSDREDIRLVKEDDRWWIDEQGGRMAADSSAVNDLLSALAHTKLAEFLDEPPADRARMGLEEPLVEVTLTVGEEQALEKLRIGASKARLGEGKNPADRELFVARDESREELFFVDQGFLDKIRKTRGELRDRSLASFKRWEIDAIELTNSSGSWSLHKSADSGDWLLGSDPDTAQKASWNAVNEILDALEEPVLDFIDKPEALDRYGLQKPGIRILLEKEDQLQVDCALGTQGPKGVYARIAGETVVKIVNESLVEKFELEQADLQEPAAEVETESETDP